MGKCGLTRSRSGYNQQTDKKETQKYRVAHFFLSPVIVMQTYIVTSKVPTISTATHDSGVNRQESASLNLTHLKIKSRLPILHVVQQKCKKTDVIYKIENKWNRATTCLKRVESSYRLILIMRSACSSISLSFDSPIESFFRNIH